MESSTQYIKLDVKQHYVLGNVIGNGSFSTVYEATSRSTGEEFAVKEIRKGSNETDVKNLENEIRILKRVSHKNIIKLKDVYEDDENLFIVMELVRGGELFEELERRGPFNEMKAHGIFCQIIDGLRFLHLNRVTHRDLKLENILISGGKVKLTDFGLSHILDRDVDYMKTRCGTPSYVAPEVLSGEYYTNAVDIWSSGIILYTMMFNEFPFSQNNLHLMYEQMMSQDISFPTSISRELEDLISCLLTPYPQERVTIQGIINHPWVKKYPYAFSQENKFSNSIELQFTSAEKERLGLKKSLSSIASSLGGLSLKTSNSCREDLLSSQEESSTQYKNNIIV